ncbi:hypothetical protein ABZV58_21940 [Nocardia sp. NPDC004654]|uniref:hypothetical protein n=1 Tax=Nocardia sp. NPDC004654 TaxID=3154776 RepID=UPI00339DB231
MIGGHSAAPPHVSVHNHLNVNDHAHVEHQVGAQFNDVVHNAVIYQTSSDDSPDRMHTVAKEFLAGGNPRRAEEILRTLHRNGHATTERSYFYVLSVLSDRSFIEITSTLSDEIHNAINAAARQSRDEWQEALEVVDQLLRYAHAEFGAGAVDDDLATALKMFGDLSADRQDEIETHLSLILNGAVQEWLTARRKHQVAAERMSGDRVGRAWKFFEAHPRHPERWVTTPDPASATDWRNAALGSVAMVFAVVTILIGEVTASGVIGAALLLAGGCLTVRCMIEWQTHDRHVHSLLARHQLQPYQQETRFDNMVDQCFREREDPRLWEITAGYRGYLKSRLQQQYGYQCHPSEVKWLVRWHVRRFCQGNAHPAAQPAEAQRASNLRALGVIVWVVVLAILILVGEIGAFLLAIGGWWGISGIARIASVPRTQRLLAQDDEAVFADEWAHYHEWLQVLADRPSDPEMQRWLALDKAHLKNEALKRADLRERDLVTYVVLTERAPFARRSRITGGPPRYEAYLVYIFLLTRYGMRTTRTYLHLANGDVRNEQHQMCTYDAVASASVAEKGVRTFRADGRPSMDSRAGRVFRLILLNGTCIAEVRESGRATGTEPPEWNDPEDVGSVPTAGFDSALKVLEAVATEGKDWITRDRERKQRWARNWCTRPLPDDEAGTQRNSGQTNPDDLTLFSA